MSSVFGDSKQELIKQQAHRLHLRALCVLTATIQSLVSWTKEIEKNSVTLQQNSKKNDEESSFNFEENPTVIGKNPLLSVSMQQVGNFLLANFVEFYFNCFCE